MNESEHKRAAPGVSAARDDLECLSDGELQEVVKRAGAILAAREKERKAEALREIQKIARAHGLNVDVKEPAQRKRGRPAKPKGAG